VSAKRFLAVGAALVLWIGILLPVDGAIVYTNETTFVAAIGAFPVFVNDFTNLGYLGQLVHPLTACQNGICYSIFSQPPLYLVAFDGALSTVETNDQIVVAFTTANVRAVGGDFFPADTNASPTSGSVSVTLNDGTTINIASQSNTVPTFLGLVSTGPLITNLVVQAKSPGAYPAMSHFYAAVGVPSLATSLMASNHLMFSWPATFPGCLLQSSPDLVGRNWTNVAVTPQQVGSSMEVVVPILGNKAFFRLREE